MLGEDRHELGATSHMRLTARDHCILRSLVGRKKGKTIQVHVLLVGEGLRAERNYNGLKVYMGLY